jgi:hypothetical protein
VGGDDDGDGDEDEDEDDKEVDDDGGRVAPSCIGQSAHEKGGGRQKIKLLKAEKGKTNVS